jgi:hypothetical protein
MPAKLLPNALHQTEQAAPHLGITMQTAQATGDEALLSEFSAIAKRES